MNEEAKNEPKTEPETGLESSPERIARARRVRAFTLEFLALLPREEYRKLEVEALRALPRFPETVKDVVGLMVATNQIDIEKVLEGGNGDE